MALVSEVGESGYLKMITTIHSYSRLEPFAIFRLGSNSGSCDWRRGRNIQMARDSGSDRDCSYGQAEDPERSRTNANIVRRPFLNLATKQLMRAFIQVRSRSNVNCVLSRLLVLVTKRVYERVHKGEKPFQCKILRLQICLRKCTEKSRMHSYWRETISLSTMREVLCSLVRVVRPLSNSHEGEAVQVLNLQ